MSAICSLATRLHLLYKATAVLNESTSHRQLAKEAA